MAEVAMFTHSRNPCVYHIFESQPCLILFNGCVGRDVVNSNDMLVAMYVLNGSLIQNRSTTFIHFLNLPSTVSKVISQNILEYKNLYNFASTEILRFF
jgi:hypothetical protein